MTFDSFLFFLIIAAAILLVSVFDRPLGKILSLLFISWFFYATWDWRFLPLVILMGAATWAGGLLISADPGRGSGRLWAVVLVLLSPLFFFKYFDFALTNVIALLGPDIVKLEPAGFILPVGISFFTFHALSYVIDIHRRSIEVDFNIARVSLYICFFPHMIAGPIVRPEYFLPQVRGTWKTPTASEVSFSVLRFLWGLAKKTLIADRLALSYVDPIFLRPDLASPEMLAVAVIAFGTMIYADFSGYSDMAISSAALMGIRFRENFAAPYMATSIQQFWRRWHISLSSWVRDYIYIPLGGSRVQSESRLSINLIAAMTLCGLWHGAAWSFLLWGAFHGTALALEHSISPHIPDRWYSKVLGWLYTTVIVYAGWVLFRAADLEAFTLIINSAVTSDQPSHVRPALYAFIVITTAIMYMEQAVLILGEQKPHIFQRYAASIPLHLALASMISAGLLLAYYPEMGSRNFIYFQF